jgi:hypothetical protein
MSKPSHLGQRLGCVRGHESLWTPPIIRRDGAVLTIRYPTEEQK